MELSGQSFPLQRLFIQFLPLVYNRFNQQPTLISLRQLISVTGLVG